MVRVYLAMQGTPLQTLVQEDPTRYGATKAVSGSSGSPRAPEPMLCSKRSQQNGSRTLRAAPLTSIEKACVQQQAPGTAPDS